MNRGTLVYEDPALFAGWLKFLLGGILALTLVIGIVLLNIDRAGSAVLFAITVFDGVLFVSIMPRKYQIYTDRLVIVLGGPFSKTLKLVDISAVKRVAGTNAFGYNGLRFTGSSEFVVEIRRKRGANIVISPSGRDYFIDQLNLALKNVMQ